LRRSITSKTIRRTFVAKLRVLLLCRGRRVAEIVTTLTRNTNLSRRTVIAADRTVDAESRVQIIIETNSAFKTVIGGCTSSAVSRAWRAQS
jgi:hypothetical protein